MADKLISSNKFRIKISKKKKYNKSKGLIVCSNRTSFLNSKNNLLKPYLANLLNLEKSRDKYNKRKNVFKLSNESKYFKSFINPKDMCHYKITINKFIKSLNSRNKKLYNKINNIPYNNIDEFCTKNNYKKLLNQKEKENNFSFLGPIEIKNYSSVRNANNDNLIILSDLPNIKGTGIRVAFNHRHPSMDNEARENFRNFHFPLSENTPDIFRLTKNIILDQWKKNIDFSI